MNCYKLYKFIRIEWPLGNWPGLAPDTQNLAEFWPWIGGFEYKIQFWPSPLKLESFVNFL